MSTRRILIGCAIIVLVLVGLALISGVTLYMSLSGRAPLPPVTLLADEDAVGVAAARLAPDDPWVDDLLQRMSRHSMRSTDPNDILPAEAVWTAVQREGDGEQYMVTLSLSPKGRLIGTLADIGLWKAGWAPDPHISRVEFEGEGITSFPGTKVPGQIFIRDNVFVWASDLDAARHAVTRMNTPVSAPPADNALLGLLPDAAGGGHALYGALVNRGGSLARCLALIPGETLDLPEERLSPVTGLSFVFDAATARSGSGRVVLRFAGGTPDDAIRDLTEDIANRIGALHFSGVTLEAVPVDAGGTGTIAVKADGLDRLTGWIEAGSDTIRSTIEKGEPTGKR